MSNRDGRVNLINFIPCLDTCGKVIPSIVLNGEVGLSHASHLALEVTTMHAIWKQTSTGPCLQCTRTEFVQSLSGCMSRVMLTFVLFIKVLGSRKMREQIQLFD